MTELTSGGPVLLKAIASTLLLFVGGSVLAIFLSFLGGLGRLAKSAAVRGAATVYTEVFRGVSLVVQLFWIYFALPAFGITLSAYYAAIVGIGLCFGAYGTEIVRSAILAVPRGQVEAAEAIGLGRWRIMVLVVFPQALLIMLPPFGNLLIQLLKSTSVAALITVPELSFQAYALNNNYGGGWIVFGFVLCVYYLLSKLLLLVLTWSERSLSRHFRPA